MAWPGGGPSGSQDLPAEFDEVAGELGRTLHFAKVPKREKAEVPAVFAATKTRSPPATSRPLEQASANLVTAIRILTHSAGFKFGSGLI